MSVHRGVFVMSVHMLAPTASHINVRRNVNLHTHLRLNEVRNADSLWLQLIRERAFFHLHRGMYLLSPVNGQDPGGSGHEESGRGQASSA